MLPRAARLVNGRDFRAAYNHSRSYASPRLVLHVRWRNLRPSTDGAGSPARFRIGFSISRKACRKAHDRNLIKRRLREIARANILPFARNCKPADVVVTARSAAVDASYDQLKEDLLRLFEQASGG